LPNYYSYRDHCKLAKQLFIGINYKFYNFSAIIQRFSYSEVYIAPMSDQPEQLKKIIFLLEEMQAIDIKIIDVHEQTSVTDYMIICSGRASRHAKAIASDVAEKMKADGLPALSTTGFENSDWVLVDFGDYVLHVMLPDSRSFYNLEGLWQDNSK